MQNYTQEELDSTEARCAVSKLTTIHKIKKTTVLGRCASAEAASYDSGMVIHTTFHKTQNTLDRQTCSYKARGAISVHLSTKRGWGGGGEHHAGEQSYSIPQKQGEQNKGIMLAARSP